MSLSYEKKIEAAKAEFKKKLSPDDASKFDACADPRKPRFLLEHGNFTESEIVSELSETVGLETVDNIEIPENAESLLPLRIINEYRCLPLSDGTAVFTWPPSDDAIKWICAISGRIPPIKLAPYSLVEGKIAESFGVGAESLEGRDADDFSDISESETQEDENAAIIKFVNEIITRALADRATDIHIEPRRDSLAIRYRIDGDMTSVSVPDNLVKFKDAIVSRIKIMARLNISEKRRPQDGRIAFRSKSGEEIDIRVSSLPTLYGESVSLRLLNQKSRPVTIEDLGFLPDDAAKISRPLSLPHGIILVTGPTGSGKSTTLTAFIRRLRSPEVRIITVEDPVEYEVEGVNQTQVNPEIGLTFSSVLRSVLRQDPDIIMVGEIRDRETADIAIRASLTGHLVLSTLHTNDSAGALTRLVDMGIEPFLIASSVEMILAQRLVRRLCKCAVPANYTRQQLSSSLATLGIPQSELEFAGGIKIPHGCDKCRSIGYYGRVGIFEILLVTEDIHSMIVSRASAREIREAARAYGMRTLQECGWELVKRGISGLDEIMCYANLNDEAVSHAKV